MGKTWQQISSSGKPVSCYQMVRFIRVLTLSVSLYSSITGNFIAKQEVRKQVAQSAVVSEVVRADNVAVKDSVASHGPSGKGQVDGSNDKGSQSGFWSNWYGFGGLLIALVTLICSAFWAGQKKKGEIKEENKLKLDQKNQQQKTDSANYQAALKAELGYISMLGLPGIESIKVNLNENTFVPLRLSDRQENGFKEKDNLQGSEHILYPDQIMKRAFQERRGRRMLLVIGDPGAGKTTLLKYYAMCALDGVHYAKLGFKAPVKVFYLPLRELIRDNDGNYDTLQENLSIWIDKHNQTIASDVFTDWLNTNPSLVLFDGLDEISNIADRIEVCRWIDNAWKGFSKAYFVVTSRETGYRKDEGIDLESDYERADVQDFTPEQQELFLLNWFTAVFLKEPCEEGFDESDWQENQTKEAAKRTQTIVAHLQAEKNKGLRQLAAIPMILQIMAILWKDREYIPESRVALYDSSLNYLLVFRDKRRNIKPLLSATDARQVLAPVSLWMQETIKKDEVVKADMHKAMQKWLDTLNTTETPPVAEVFCKNLVNRAGLLVECADKEYLFRHKSFREYLAGVQLKEDRPYDQINKLVTNFGDDWWKESLRFFISSVDANVFDSFMEKLFNSPQSEALTTKQQIFLQTLIEEAKGVKIDALCNKLLDSTTTASRQRVILDCLKTIGKPIALNSLNEFKARNLSKNKDVADKTDEVMDALHELQETKEFTGNEENTVPKKIIPKPINLANRPASFRNQHEHNAEYILIPGGRYLFSKKKKEVHVNDLYFAKYPVTNKLYRSFIDALGGQSKFREGLQDIANKKIWDPKFAAYFKEGKNDLAALFRSPYDEDRKFGGNDQPVVGITWYAAQAYALWLSQREGKPASYRLPSEVEWEWAAGGKQGEVVQEVRKYPWAENREPDSKLLNHDNNEGATTPVGSYPDGATPEGLYDMAGNVWEWTDSFWDESASNRVIRGGCWFNHAVRCRSAFRSSLTPDYRNYYVGFRLVFVP